PTFYSTPTALTLWFVLATGNFVLGELPSAPFSSTERIPLTTLRVEGSPEPPLPYTTEKWPTKIEWNSTIYAAAEPGRQALLVILTQGEGQLSTLVRVPDNNPLATEAEKLLEIPSWLVYSLTFHPQYQENGYVYLGSNGPIDKGNDRVDRIARYTVDPTGKIDPASELIIIEWKSNGHNGVALSFGHDGMLYVTSGDGTSDSDAWLSAQDVTNLLGGVLRIDVDHPTEDKPYSIPPDNPFLTVPGARGELWAIGLRNPWRMCTDRKTGQIWVGNNGQDLWETVHLIRRGENYGWSVYEGNHPFYLNRQLGPAPYVPPTLEHHHQESRSLTGGEVYYGSQLPELDGAYIYGDFSTGKIWGARHDGTRITWHRELADTSLLIVGFAVTHSGELLVVEYGNGLHRIIPQEPLKNQIPFPRKLSETGLFASTKNHEMQPGVIPYEVNAPGWVDGAIAERHVALPEGATMGFNETRNFDLPDRSVILQTLSIPNQNGEPAYRVETRMLLRERNEWVGYSYLWNREQDDADLVGMAGAEIELPIADQASTDAKRPWHVPSRSECMSCHARQVGYVLGLSQPQLNRVCEYDDGKQENQLEVLKRAGIVGGDFPRPLAEMPQLVNPYDPQHPLDARARSYLHTNCSVCHILTGGGNARMELEITTDANSLAIIDQHPQHDTLGVENARIVAPGEPERSILFQRISRRGRGQMPPLVTKAVDPDAVELIRQWIQAMPPSRKFVREWTLPDVEQLVDRVPSVQNSEQGKQIFRDAGCIQCHRRSDEGGGAGPDLTNLGMRRKATEILESIILPSKTVAPEFATTQIHTVDGLQHLGRIEREDDERVILRTSNSFAGPLEILKEDIEERGLSPLSSMPVGLLNTWELDQIADLLAYLIGSEPQAEPPGQSP
ncbi:MAG: PQQ-dependent sugar dehydrogenase, partial [Planctomycetota bacterium]|nr:PQQ-dependent sugar dehydrogenase [Planctomycetota bacterium]